MKNKRLLVSVVAGLLTLVLLLSLILGILPQARAAQSSSAIKDQINNLEGDQKDLQAEIDSLQASLKENLSDINELSKQKGVLEQQVGLLHAQIDSMNDQIAAYALLIADKQEELNKAEERLAELNRKHKERIRAMEEDGQLSYWAVLFQANSFADFLDRLNMVQQIAASDRRRLAEMEQAAKEVQEAKAVLIEEKKGLEATREELKAKEAQLEEKRIQASDILSQMIAKGDEYQALIDKQEEELAKLEQEIANKKFEYDEAVYREWLATSVPPTTKPPATGNGGVGGSGVQNGNLVWIVPCDYIRVSSPFGDRWHPVHGGWRFHAGVDLAAGCPNHIYATRAGVVEISQWSDSAGWYVVINHTDGYKSTYMHMCKRPSVKVGDFVTAGQIIGCIGTTGASTGNHLHFGISYNGVYKNPMDYIG